ncbi:HepT-like ribonuclease domain-containing protein [Leptospira inadai]
MAGIRDILAHGYFAIDDEILWDIVKNRLTPLKVVCINIKNKI